jgi:hypothetical protein
MDGCLMYRGETMSARFDDAILSLTSDIPGMYVSSPIHPDMMTLLELHEPRFGGRFAAQSRCRDSRIDVRKENAELDRDDMVFDCILHKIGVGL